MNKKTSLLLLALVFLTAGGAIGLAVGTSSGDKHDECGGHASYTFMVDIHDGSVSNTDVKGRMCDKIMFTNDDKLTREIGFGPHDEHTPYNGVSEKILNQNDSFTISLNEIGTFHWHDHLHDEVGGYFTVTN